MAKLEMEDFARHTFEELSLKHGITQYSFNIINTKTIAARCRFDNHTIEFSKYYLLSPKVTKEDIVDTCLHEIAHALAGPTVEPHGKEWKEIARKIGCSGHRCAGKFLENHHYRWKLTCGEGCEKLLIKKPKQRLKICAKHRKVLKLVNNK
jgi:predicted SprT family Zn-dependent metalloprotease